LFYTRQRAEDGTTGLAQPYWLKIANFPQNLSFSALAWGNPFQIYEKASLIVFQVADGEDLVILACTVFD